MPNSVIINYAEIVKIIEYELNQAKSLVTEYDLSRTNLVVGDEQTFLRSQDEINENNIYVAIRFGASALNHGSSACSLSLVTLGTPNKIRPTQALLNTFANNYNIQYVNYDLTEHPENGDIIQYWYSPSVVTNFVEAGMEFRSLFSMSGTFVIGQSILKIKKIEYKHGSGATDWEEVNFLSAQDGYGNALNPQPFYNSNGFVQSVAQYATYSITISTYLLSDSKLIRNVMAQKGFTVYNGSTDITNNNYKNNPDAKYELKITYEGVGGITMVLSYSDFRLSNSRASQELAAIGATSFTFER